jgi:hypothetical protein
MSTSVKNDANSSGQNEFGTSGGNAPQQSSVDPSLEGSPTANAEISNTTAPMANNQDFKAGQVYTINYDIGGPDTTVGESLSDAASISSNTFSFMQVSSGAGETIQYVQVDSDGDPIEDGVSFEINNSTTKEGGTPQQQLTKKVTEAINQVEGVGTDEAGNQKIAYIPGEAGMYSGEFKTAGATAELAKAVGSTAIVKDEDGEVIATGQGGEEGYNQQIQEVDDAARKEAQKFIEKISGIGAQNFFLENIKPFVEKARDNFRKGGYYTGGHLYTISMNKPSLFLNTLFTRKGGFMNFSQGTSLMYSSLIPEIRIYMEMENGEEIQIPFSTHLGSKGKSASATKFNDTLRSRGSRGEDVGLTELTWQYYGGSEGTLLKSSAGSLQFKLYFQSGNSIFLNRQAFDKKKKAHTFNFSDFLASKATTSTDKETYNSGRFRLRIVVGYNHSDNFQSVVKDSKGFYQAAKNATKSFYCSPSEAYDLDFQEDGGIMGTFKFHFVSESTSKDDTFDVFDSVALKKAKKALRDLKAHEARKKENKSGSSLPSGKIESPPAGENNDKAEKAVDKAEQDYKKALNLVYKDIRNSILKRAFKISLTKGALQNYLRVRQTAKGAGAVKGLPAGSHLWYRTKDLKTNKIVESPFSTKSLPNNGPGVSDKEKKQLENPSEGQTTEKSAEKEQAAAAPKPTPAESSAKESAKHPEDAEQAQAAATGTSKASASGLGNLEVNESASDDVELYYVHFGDIVAAFVEQPHILKQMKSENFNIIIGQLWMAEVLKGRDNSMPPEGILVNIADVPIAIDSVNAWFTDIFVKPQIKSMTLYEVLRNLVNRLLTPMFNNPDVVRGGSIPRTRNFTITSLESSKSPAKLKIGGRTKKMPETKSFKVAPLKTPTSKKSKHNYLIITSDPYGFYIPRDGNQVMDEKAGIIHYFLAKDRGLLKSVGFKKESIPFAREMNVADEASDATTNGPRFWEPYAANMELIGNPYLEPYSIFYLNPTAPGMGSLKDGTSPASRLNVGGYYHITQIQNTIADGIWTSSVEGTKALGTVDVKSNKSINTKKVDHDYVS